MAAVLRQACCRSTAAASTSTESNLDQLNGITFDWRPPGQCDKWKPDPDRYVPMTEEELDAELDAVEAEELLRTRNRKGAGIEMQPRSALSKKLAKCSSCVMRSTQGAQAAYEILAEGNKDQVNVARNILEQLDAD